MALTNEDLQQIKGLLDKQTEGLTTRIKEGAKEQRDFFQKALLNNNEILLQSLASREALDEVKNRVDEIEDEFEKLKKEVDTLKQQMAASR